MLNKEIYEKALEIEKEKLMNSARYLKQDLGEIIFVPMFIEYHKNDNERITYSTNSNIASTYNNLLDQSRNKGE